MKLVYKMMAVMMLVLLAVGTVSADVAPAPSKEKAYQDAIDMMKLAQKSLDAFKPTFAEYNAYAPDLNPAIEALSKEL